MGRCRERGIFWNPNVWKDSTAFLLHCSGCHFKIPTRSSEAYHHTAELEGGTFRRSVYGHACTRLTIKQKLQNFCCQKTIKQKICHSNKIINSIPYPNLCLLFRICFVVSLVQAQTLLPKVPPSCSTVVPESLNFFLRSPPPSEQQIRSKILD